MMYADKHPSYLRSIELLSGGTGLLLKASGFPPYYSFFFCSCFFFPKILQAVSLTFSALSFANIRSSLLHFLLLISSTNFEKAAPYFSTSNPAFSQAYVHCLRASFSPAETSFTALSFRSFYNRLFFPLMPSQKGYNQRS